MKSKSPIKKYEMDKKASWEVRYKKLEKHHREETQWLINEINRLELELIMKTEKDKNGRTLEERLKSFNTRPYRGSDLVIC